MPSRRSPADAARLIFAQERLVAVVPVTNGVRERATAIAPYVSALSGAVPQIRADGLVFTLCDWYGKDKAKPKVSNTNVAARDADSARPGDGRAKTKDNVKREIADWCFEWFSHQAPRLLRLKVPATPVDRIKWLLERESAELRLLTRESEAFIEQLMHLAKGYDLEAEREEGFRA